MNENILPRPVIRDKSGKLTKDYSTRDWFLKLQEEIFEVMEQHFWFKSILADEGYSEGANCQRKFVAEEIADIITVCISYLNAIGYNEKMRSEIFRRVNEKNEKRGYFEESDSNV